MKATTVRLAGSQDAKALTVIYAEMNAHFFPEKTFPADLTENRLQSALFSDRPSAEVLVAERGERFEGLLIFPCCFLASI